MIIPIKLKYSEQCGVYISYLENGIATGYGLDDRIIGVRFPAEAGNYSLRHPVHTGSGSHLTFYSVGNGGSIPAGKADHSPPSSAETKECVELYLHSPDTFRWRGA
jgi:hypothetical protein